MPGLVELKEGVDRASPGHGVVYFSRLAARASSSRLSRLVRPPGSKDMTIRSWNTTRNLLARLRAREEVRRIEFALIAAMRE